MPPLLPRQVIPQHPSGNDFAGWFGSDFNKLNIVATYNLVYNAAILVESGIGYAVTLDWLTNTSPESSLCFRPLYPRLESGPQHHLEKIPGLFPCCGTVFEPAEGTVSADY